MPIFDFQCDKCGAIFEQYVHDATIPYVTCRECKDGHAAKQFSFRSAYKEDANWLASVLEVVDKDSDKPHVRKFLENPTRTNWRNWMKGEGLRPLENNERSRPSELNIDPIVKEVTEYLKDWDKIEI